MIKLSIGAIPDEMEKHVKGVEFSVNSYEDEIVGVQIGSMIVEVNKKNLIHMVNNLEMKR